MGVDHLENLMSERSEALSTEEIWSLLAAEHSEWRQTSSDLRQLVGDLKQALETEAETDNSSPESSPKTPGVTVQPDGRRL